MLENRRQQLLKAEPLTVSSARECGIFNLFCKPVSNKNMLATVE